MRIPPPLSQGQWSLRLFLLAALIVCSSTVIGEQDVVSSYKEQHSTTTRRRSLQDNDWQAFNNLIHDAVIRFPDSSMNNAGLTLKVRNLQCTNVRVNDITVTSSRTSDQQVLVTNTVRGLDMVCTANYEFEGWLVVGGSGNLYVESFDNQATLQTAFESLDYNQYPPHDTWIKSCQPTININKMDFSNGGFLGWTLDRLQGMFRGKFESMAEDRFCDELHQTSNENMDQVLQDWSNRLDQYPADIVIDPLKPEDNLLGPATAYKHFINWQAPETYAFGLWMDQAWNETVQFLNKEIDIEDASSGQVIAVDKQVNQMLRDHVLESNGALIIDVDKEEDRVVYQGHDQWTQTRVTVNQMQIIGLDTMTTLDPLIDIGKYTLQSKLAWEELAVKMNVTLAIQPSTLEDSYITGASQKSGIVEHVTVEFSMAQVQAGISVLLALDQAKLEALQLGHFLEKDNILPCLLSSVYKVEVASLSAEAIHLAPPRISGFVSRGLDRVVSNAVQAAFLMYESSLLRSSRAFFQKAIREVVNDSIDAKYESYGQEACVLWELPSAPGMVDFRDLLLPPEEAALYGGAGTRRYGNLFPEFVMPTMTEHMLTNDKINSQFLRPFTLTQSGEEGTLRAKAPVFDQVIQKGDQQHSDTSWITYLGWERLEIKAYDATLRNLDTVVSPVEVLEPLMAGRKVANTIRTGSVDGSMPPVSFSARFSLSGQSNNGAPDMYNEMDVSFTVPSSLFTFDIRAVMNETSLLHFPLKDLANKFCWLATLSQGSAANPALDLPGMLLSLSEFSFDLACVSCSSPGSTALPKVLTIIKEAGFYSLLHPYVEQIVAELAESAWRSMNVNNMLIDAPRFCPHNSAYDYTAVAPKSYGLVNESFAITQWSHTAVEAFVATGFVSLYSAAIVIAKNSLLKDPETSSTGDIAVLNETVIDNNGTSDLRLLDWTNLSATVGLWADTALEDARHYLSELHTDVSWGPTTRRMAMFEHRSAHYNSKENLRVNVLVRDFLLNGNDTLVLTLDNLRFEAMGVSFNALEARIEGLDSISHIDAFRVVAPQRLENSILLDTLKVTLLMEVQAEEMLQNMTATFSFQDVAVDMSLLLAIDLDRLGLLELGTLLRTSQIVPCLLPGAHEVFIPKLNITVGEIANPTLEGFLSSELKLAVTSVSESLSSTFARDLCSAIPDISDTLLRSAVNKKLEEFVQRRDPNLCSVSPGDGFVDFRDLLLPAVVARSLGGSGKEPYGNLFEIFHRMLNKELSDRDVDGSLTINTLVASWTNEQFNASGLLQFPGDLVDASTHLKLAGLNATLRLRLSDVSIVNVDSLGSPISVLDPVGAHGLNNTVTFGNGPEPVQLSAIIMFSLFDDEEMEIRNEMHVSVGLHAVEAFVTILLRIREKAFFAFPLRDIPNIYCWLATVFAPTGDAVDPNQRSIAMMGHSFLVESLNFNVTCVSCTSPRFDQLITDLYTPSDDDEPTDTFQQTASQVLDGDAIQSFLNQVVADSSRNCPHSDEYDPDAPLVAAEYMENPAKPFGFTDFSVRDNRSSYFNIASGIFAACLFCFLLAGKWWVNRRNKNWKDSLTEEGLFLLRRQKAREEEQDTTLNLYSTSLFQNPHIPEKIRWLVPVAIAINICLYMGGHLGVLSTVNIDVQLAGEEFMIHRMLDFSFLASTAKTYQNGGMEMSIMLWLFTGIWPYLKLLASLFLWFAPPRILSVSKRGTFLLWIDTLTKLSIVDIFTMLLSFALFLVYIGGPDEALSSGDLYAMKVIVVPGASFYCIVVAQRMSRVSSRFFLDYHDRAVVAAREAMERGDIMDIYGNSKGNSNNEEMASARSDQEQATRGEERIGGVDKQKDSADYCSVLSAKEETSSINGPDDNEIATSEQSGIQIRLSFLKLRSLSGHLGVFFGGLTVLVLGIIGCIFAPSVAIEISDLWGLILESDATYKEAVSDYGVFSIVSAILLKSRFVLDATWDYVALGFLLTVGIVSIGGVFFVSSYRVIRRLLDEGWSALQSQGTPLYQLPSYLRLYAYKHIEVYVVAVVIGCWQLGAVSIYAIHLYCSILDAVYKLLAYIGLADKPTAECFPIQMSQPDNLIIFLGSFFILLANFGIQSIQQYRKNIRVASDLLHHNDHDVERLSTLWNSPSSVKENTEEHSTRALHLNETASFSEGNSFSDDSAPEDEYIQKARSSSPFALTGSSPSKDDYGSISAPDSPCSSAGAKR